MLSKTVNLRNELVSEKSESGNEAGMLESVFALLADNELQRDAIRDTLNKGKPVESNLFRFDLLEKDRIFHIGLIRKVCIDYRLRFLDSSLFKNGIPEEAVTKIRELEKMHGSPIGGFKIVAPTQAFRLLNYNDPMLFAPLGNGYYYLIHQWGNDMNRSRKWLVLPFRNIGYFTLFCLILSLILTGLIPSDKLSRTVPMASVIIFLFAFKSVFAVLMYGFFMGGRKFNSGMWDSQYFNN